MISIEKNEIQFNHNTSQWRRALIVGPGFLLALIITGLLLTEWIRIGFIGSPKEIEKYYFGSEAMISHGGWKYGSATKYAWSAFGEGIFAGTMGLLFIYGYLRSSKKIIAIGYAGIALLLGFLWFA